MEEGSGVHVNLGAQVTLSAFNSNYFGPFLQLWREYTGASEEELEAKTALWRRRSTAESGSRRWCSVGVGGERGVRFGSGGP